MHTEAMTHAPIPVPVQSVCAPVPFGSARPHRGPPEFIEYALECGDVRFARCGEVARAVCADDSIAPRTLSHPAPDPDVYPD
jgi:hypothetical protein